MNELLDLLISQAMVGASFWVRKHKLEDKLSTLSVALELQDIMIERKRKISELSLILILNQGRPSREIDNLGKSLAYKMGVEAARKALGKLLEQV